MLADDIIITGNRAIARSYAKINLTLDVLGRRPDGYHDVEMIMQTVSLFDLLIIDKTHKDITISTNLKFLPNNEKNIAYMAAREFFRYTGIIGGCKIMIHKNIPVAAGLAGGSGNAAAVLCALDMLYNTQLDTDTLCMLGLKLGADVPYCILGGTALAEGIGERLTPLPSLAPCTILMVKPSVNVSTGTIYEAIDSAEITERPDTPGMIDAIHRGDINAVASKLSNVMGTVTEGIHPIIRGIKKKMIMNGALGAVMSGSGPTVFGIFPDFKTAKTAHDSFSYQFKEVFVVKTK
ncbi:MAG: 4-(cytidine 5'-diphospho)-2-C-methyl-D-erythritol kinase [Candidatus Ornithomonoglobus sp.]